MPIMWYFESAGGSLLERTETERCCVWGKIRDVLYRLDLDSEYTRTWRKLYETSSGINISPKMTPPVTNIIWQILCNQPIAQPNPLLKIRIFVRIYWNIYQLKRQPFLCKVCPHLEQIILHHFMGSNYSLSQSICNFRSLEIKHFIDVIPELFLRGLTEKYW